MVPQRIQYIEEMHGKGAGKIDRERLRMRDGTARSVVDRTSISRHENDTCNAVDGGLKLPGGRIASWKANLRN